LIGSMTLGTVHVSKGKGDILQSTTFQILNTTAFSQFAKVMVCRSTLNCIYIGGEMIRRGMVGILWSLNDYGCKLKKKGV